MDWVKAALLTGLLNLLLMNAAPAAWAADGGRGNSCRRGDRVQIQDLDMAPDPVVEGQRIREWKLRIRFDGRRDCDVHRPGPRSQSGATGAVSRVRSVCTPRRARAVADCRGSTDIVADRSSGYSPPNRTAGHRRGQRNHRGHVAASRGCIRCVSVRYRTHQTDCADLEARALRGR